MSEAGRSAAVLSLAVASALCQPVAAQIREASGVTRFGDHLLIADDSEVGGYWRAHLHGDSKPGAVFDLNELGPERVKLKQKGLGVDTEAIAVLADARVVLLSERLRSLVSDGGIVAEYDSELAEIGKRGLEGLAVRALADGSTRVAVLWEGGYPDFGIGPRRVASLNAWKPWIVVHDVPRLGKVGRVRLQDATAIELQVPQPPGQEPEAQRFRAPDLCWYRWPGSGEEERWGFLVLLSSQSGGAAPAFEFKWLQRFDDQGRAVGEPLDLARHMPAELQAANWEGMSWYEPGRSVVLVHESERGRLAPHGLILELPREWQP